jgi:excinuclease ABC subunit C
MGRCAAPCAGKISKEDYNKIVRDVILFLKGRNDTLVEYLKSRMLKASNELRFEDAAKLRDQVEAVESVIKKQKIISTKLENQDVIVFYREGTNASVQILMIRNGKMTGDKSYKLTKLDAIDDDELIASFIKQYYADEPVLPQEILLSMDIKERNIIAQWLSEKNKNKVIIQVPKKGRKKNLVKMAEENARFAFRKEEQGQAILEELKEIMGFRNIPARIEAFDISSISGSMAVGASVLFVNGEPFKKGYRRFKIRDFKGADDYGMISQIVLRHYARLLDEDKELPHLIIIDGGKGHLNAAARILDDLDLLKKIDLMAIAKGRERNKLETDEIYTLKHKEPAVFPVDSPMKFLLQRIRDEAHRFAITYHRKLRRKGGLHSILDDIAGIGEKRKKQLIKHFGGAIKLKSASVDKIKEVPYISEKIAKEIKAKI